MDVNTALTRLSKRVEDKHNNFDEDTKLAGLSDGQRDAATTLVFEYLGELERQKAGITVTNGIVPINSSILGAEVLHGQAGFRKARMTGGKWIIKIDFDKVERTENYFYGNSGGTIHKPQCYLFQGNLVLLPPTIKQVDVFFMKVPDDVQGGGTFELNSALHELILTFAESYLWRTVDQKRRADDALALAIEKVKILNGRYLQPKIVGDPDKPDEEPLPNNTRKK